MPEEDEHMKFTALIVSLLLPLSHLSAEEAPAATEFRGPRIHCDEPVHDFGTADNRTSVEHTFILKNIGDTTLEISNTRAACGCTVANMSNRSVPPGGQTELTARLNLQGRNGHQSKSITVMSNDPEQGNYVVTLTGNASQSISVSPERIMFGQVTPGQEATMSVDITSVGGQALTIGDIESDNAGIRVEKESTEGNVTRLKVSLKSGLTPGAITSMIRVKTDHPERPVIEIPVMGSLVGEIIYAPQEIVVPGSPASGPLTRYVVLRSGSGDSFEISGIELPDPGMKSTILPFGSQGYRVQIENVISGPELNGGVVKISTTSASQPVIEIPFRTSN